MNVSLPPDLVPFVDQLVAAGGFPSAQEAVSEALRRLQDDEEKFAALKATFDEAIEELERTGGKPLDFDEIRRKGRALAAARRAS
jgi:putative addiction module CopG family antidote